VEAAYPTVDMLEMPFRDGSFDLVLHSDTLEHVPNPIRGLAECKRVLRAGGACCFTVPIVVGRLTRSRQELPPSYHGSPNARLADYIVHTEYGADAWRHAMEAGFAEVRLIQAEFPAALAIVAVP
jgi:ubiquinone/menaquinone biosynthesis C-methylase UbiE